MNVENREKIYTLPIHRPDDSCVCVCVCMHVCMYVYVCICVWAFLNLGAYVQWPLHFCLIYWQFKLYYEQQLKLLLQSDQTLRLISPLMNLPGEAPWIFVLHLVNWDKLDALSTIQLATAAAKAVVEDAILENIEQSQKHLRVQKHFWCSNSIVQSISKHCSVYFCS